jgi:hypothetical protein
LIVRAGDRNLLLITQPDHAALAAELMSEWKGDGLLANPRRATILLATREHDAGWQEFDEQPLLDESGQIRDFLNMPAETHRTVWPHSIERLAGTPYAAALVAQHALHLFRDHRGEAAYEPFMQEMEAARDRCLTDAAVGPDILASDYFFVRMGDLLSLTFCNGWVAPRCEGPYTAHVDGERLVVSPDPFGGREIPVAIRARRMDQRTFAAPRDLASAFAGAPVELIAGVAGGP